VVVQDRIPAELPVWVAAHQQLRKKVARLTAIVQAAQHQTQPLTRVVAVVAVDMAHHIWLVAMAVQASSSSKCHRLFMLCFHPG
jgi:hypothetical protein